MNTPDTEGEVILAPEGTPLAIFQKERTDAIGEMFDNEDEYGIFPTGKFYARLDKCVESLLTSRDTYWKERVRKIKEKVERVRLDVDVIKCDCGEPYKDSDLDLSVGELEDALKK